jgi:hypothetical protein
MSQQPARCYSHVRTFILSVLWDLETFHFVMILTAIRWFFILQLHICFVIFSIFLLIKFYVTRMICQVCMVQIWTKSVHIWHINTEKCRCRVISASCRSVAKLILRSIKDFYKTLEWFFHIITYSYYMTLQTNEIQCLYEIVHKYGTYSGT